MKILMMSNTFFPVVGGLERSIESFAEKFRSWGHEVMIAFPEIEGAEKNKRHLLAVPGWKGFDATRFPITSPYPKMVEKKIKVFRPDIIHAHHPFLMGEMAVRIASQYKKPLIYTHHILFEQYPHYMPLPPAIARTFLVELSVGFANLASHVIAPSESVYSILTREGVRTPMSVVPTGINLRELGKGNGLKFRKFHGIPEKAMVVGYAGRLAREKNLQFLTGCLIAFVRKNKAHFLVAGTGPLAELIQKEFSFAGLENHLHLAGVLRGRELSDAYHAMDVFAFASKSETQGLVLAEAMAAGVPVVALDGPGVREIVKDKQNGCLIARENQALFNRSLEWCVKTAKLPGSDLCVNARNTAKLFSIACCAKKALAVYRNAQPEKSLHGFYPGSRWNQALERMKAEWKLLRNFANATSLALKEVARA